jgi:hypothetical protein
MGARVRVLAGQARERMPGAGGLTRSRRPRGSGDAGRGARAAPGDVDRRKGPAGDFSRAGPFSVDLR